MQLLRASLRSMFPNMIHYNSVTSALASSSSSWSVALMMKSMDTVGMNAKIHALGAVEWRSTTEILSRMRSSSILQVSVFFFSREKVAWWGKETKQKTTPLKTNMKPA